MELADLLVRRHEHEHAQALADQAVDDVEEAGEALADDGLRVGREQLAGVLEHEQAPTPLGGAATVPVLLLELGHQLDLRELAAVRRPAARLEDLHPFRARLHEDVHQVVGVLAEERVRIDDVVEAAPVAPLPRERSQREGLPRAGVAVPEHQLPPVCRPEALHQPVESGARRGGVVRCDLAPLRNGDRPPRGHRPMR